MAAPLAGKRLLLIVEDDVLASLLGEAAARLGAVTAAAGTGRAGLEALAAARADAAVLDLPLPDVRGSEVLAALKRAGVPVVAISGTFRGPRAAGEVLRAGAADFFEKPFPVLALMARLARLMGAALPGLAEPEDEVTGAVPLRPAAELPGAIDDAPFLDLTDDDAVDGLPAPPAPTTTPLATLAAP
ncbi:MAG: response regulator, partial [Anaeromyxobacteraceae bacterium]|nr:response regulator [Anaeromyxobacteraceae bacterium]